VPLFSEEWRSGETRMQVLSKALKFFCQNCVPECDSEGEEEEE